MKNLIAEFKEFINRGNVIDMAVSIIIGAAFTAIVTSLTDDIINRSANSSPAARHQVSQLLPSRARHRERH